jgi:uncharacterized membrane protein
MRTRATTTPTAVGTAWLGTGSIFTRAKLKYKKNNMLAEADEINKEG